MDNINISCSRDYRTLFVVDSAQVMPLLRLGVAYLSATKICSNYLHPPLVLTIFLGALQAKSYRWVP